MGYIRVGRSGEFSPEVCFSDRSLVWMGIAFPSKLYYSDIIPQRFAVINPPRIAPLFHSSTLRVSV